MGRVSIWLIAVFAVACSVAPVLAQETTGTVIGAITSQDGQPLPGVTVTIEDPERGFARTVVSAASGRYTVAALPPTSYRLTASLDGFKTVERVVRVELGRAVTSDIEMRVGEFTETIEVTGEAPKLDVTSTVSGLVASTDELSDWLPISRDVTRVALLAPGTIEADSRFSGVNDVVQPGTSSALGVYTPGQNVPVVGGASAAENGYLVNGLNITNFRQMVGSSYVPMEFVEEVQVKTGGYEAEFGRSTGGVINLVTKSGSNTLHGDASLYWMPEDLQELEPDTFQRDDQGALSLYRANSNESRESLEANASLGGPLLRDRLFLFGFARYSDWSRLDMIESNLARRSEAADPYWGGKLDWLITSAHRLEGTYISDVVTVDESFYAVDPDSGEVGSQDADGYSDRGGDSWVVKYSGLLRTNLLLSAQYGVNPFDRTTRSDADDVCPVAVDFRGGQPQRIGCWVNGNVFSSSDERTAYRLDLDWVLDRHSLRSGVDAEVNTSDAFMAPSGGAAYLYYLNGTEDGPPYRYGHLPWDQELVLVQNVSIGGSFEVVSNAAYLQDSWTVIPQLTLNLGVRWERFEVKDPLGRTFMEVNDQLAPRLGAVWDVTADGRSKLYGSFGVYHLAMSTDPAARLAGGTFYEETWYTLVGGVNANGSPQGLGDQLDTTVYADGEIPDLREVLDSDFDPMSQSELILGYERLVGGSWALGVRAVGRRFNEVIEDFYLDQALYEVYGVEDCYALGCGHQVLTNPGTDFSGWYDLDGDGELDPIVLTADQIGLPDAERTYLAVELTATRRFAGRWMMQGSYTWSHLYGNYDGLVLSDRGQDWPYTSQAFDLPALMEHGDGDLPNDRRHNLKLFGMYAFDFGLQLSGSAWFRSGRPVNSFGWHPTDPWARAYSNPYAFYTDGEPCPRGCAGTTDSAWALDLGVRYDWSWLGAEWNVRVDAFNVTDSSSVEVVDENAENLNYQPNPSHLLPRYYQAPRSVRLGFGASF
jgi:hypothetical protein